MGLPRTFVGFSGSDYFSFVTMLGWKASEHIDFDFCNVQLDKALASKDPTYIKRRCREQISQAGTYILLIGTDTWQKTEYVKDEVEVAIEKKCRLIAVNLNNSTRPDGFCPSFISKAGAVFTSYSPHIIHYALQNWVRPNPQLHEWYYYPDSVYSELNYVVTGMIARLRSKPKPWEL